MEYKKNPLPPLCVFILLLVYQRLSIHSVSPYSKKVFILIPPFLNISLTLTHFAGQNMWRVSRGGLVSVRAVPVQRLWSALPSSLPPLRAVLERHTDHAIIFISGPFPCTITSQTHIFVLISTPLLCVHLFNLKNKDLFYLASVQRIKIWLSANSIKCK